MCGILGCYDFPGFDVPGRLERIAHRGPDGSGIAASGPAVHGHVRLALLDLTSASAQPFARGGVLSFNGEIWNHAAVRAELEALGEEFFTSGDTEVLAAALDRWGVDSALPRLEGMFAFAWSKGDCHVLVRDRYGKVPLHVHRSGRSFAWSSEMKGLGREMPSAPLPPASILDLATRRLRRWYDVPPASADPSPAPILADLREGVRARLVADAPLCCLVSGGLDSSLILRLAKEAKPDVVAYTAKLDDGSADLAAARRLCAELEVPLQEVTVRAPSRADLVAAVRAIELSSKAQVEIAALCIPLAGAVASDGFKACLSGEAADELFGGYGSMCIKASRADDAGWRAIRLEQLAKMARGNFVRCNKAFMAQGVECRLPFMHRALVERVLGLGKAACPPGKRALKTAARAVLPAWVVNRQKDTFQGGSGMDEAAARAVANPARFYNAEFRSAFGGSHPA